MAMQEDAQLPKRTASCVCGSMKAHVVGDPLRVSMCHCLACQKRTGSIFGVQARFLPSQVEFEGDSKQFSRIGDSGGQIDYKFCPDCGSTISWEIDKMEGIVFALGCFADPEAFSAPSFSVYEARAHSWGKKAIPTDATHWD